MNKIRAIVSSACVLLIAAGAVFAAPGASGTAESAAFLQKALQGSRVEIELGEIAQRNASTTGIYALGTRLARDHRRIGKILELISQDRGVVVPTSLEGEHRAAIDALSAKTGVEFDAAYAARMVAAHEQLIALFDEAVASDDADVAAFARQALPVLREGKRLAEVYREVTSRHLPQSQTVAQTR